MHVVTRPPPPFPTAGGLDVVAVPSATDNLCWLIVAGDEVAVVDGPDADAVLAWCDANGKRLVAIVNTHTHGDHVGVNADLGRRGRLAGLRVIGPAKVAADVPGLTEPVGDGDVVRLFGRELRVMLTEGHIDGHVSYVLDDVLFCGDTLFAGGCGYLFHGPPPVMFDSLMRLAALPGGTRVCCAHEYTQDNLRFAWSVEPGNAALADRVRRVAAIRADGGCTLPSTIDEERATNPFLRPGSPEIVAAVRRALPDADTSTPEAVFAATRRLKDSKQYRSLPDPFAEAPRG